MRIECDNECSEQAARSIVRIGLFEDFMESLLYRKHGLGFQ